MDGVDSFSGKEERSDTSGGNPADPPSPYADQVASRRRGTRRAGFAAVIVALLLILGAGTAAAFTVPVFTANATNSVAQMLPAGTVFYVSADLNPTGVKLSNLERIRHAFIDQPGWANIAKLYNSSTHQQSSQSTCYQQTQKQISANLGDLGHDTALAMTREVKGSANSTETLKQSLVVVAPLHVQRTLFQALSGLTISLPQHASDYHGTAIYAETFRSCGQATANSAQTVYAALIKNYVILGLAPQALYPVIDVGSGRSPSLASTGDFKALAAQLAGDHLAGYYINGRALNDMNLVNGLGSFAAVRGSSVKSASSALRPVAGAVYVDGSGFRLTGAALTKETGPVIPAAGALTSDLPSDILALISIQGLKSSLGSLLNQTATLTPLQGATQLQLKPLQRDLTGNLSGEIDLVLFPGHGKLHLSAAQANLPVALLWQVRNSATARLDLADAARRLKINGQLGDHVASDGTPYRATSQGYGYAVRQGWAIVSPDMAQTIRTLSTPPSTPLSSLSSYQAAQRSGMVATSLWYVNATTLRQTLEQSILPASGSATVSQYHEYVQPFLTPVHSLSGSAGTTSNRSIAVSNLVIRIGR